LNDFYCDKIIWWELSDKPKFVYDLNGYFVDATVFIMSGENLKFILSILNSTLWSWYFSLISTTSWMWTIRWKKYKIEKFPIKQISPESQKPFIDLVDQILEITKKEDYLEREDLQKQVKVLENKIDYMVYKLYELNSEEIESVEGSLKSSKTKG